MKNKEKSEYDDCVSCGVKTSQKKTDNVNVRPYYVEGVGQLCKSCNNEVYNN
jgi:hypothetical protein